jgi:hypothetical protein
MDETAKPLKWVKVTTIISQKATASVFIISEVAGFESTYDRKGVERSAKASAIWARVGQNEAWRLVS